MSSGRHSFKLNDATRLIKAATAAGCKVKGVTLKDGAVTLRVDDDAEQLADTERELAEFEARHGKA
jgi:hypothetical protein